MCGRRTGILYATGARLAGTLARTLEDKKGKLGIATFNLPDAASDSVVSAEVPFTEG